MNCVSASRATQCRSIASPKGQSDHVRPVYSATILGRPCKRDAVWLTAGPAGVAWLAIRSGIRGRSLGALHRRAQAARPRDTRDRCGRLCAWTARRSESSARLRCPVDGLDCLGSLIADWTHSTRAASPGNVMGRAVAELRNHRPGSTPAEAQRLLHAARRLDLL